MGYRLIKHLESSQYNRKLFFLDRGVIDLPPITDFTAIMPGSEARSLSTGEKWILNTQFKWVYVGVGDCCCTGGSGSGNGGGNGTGDGDVPVPGQEPSIEGVTISPQNITVGLGSTVSFMAKVEGNSKLNQGITWTVKGQNSTDTKITTDGILTIGKNERSKTITVRATSQGDSSKYAQAVVTVDAYMENPLEEQITGVIIMPDDVEVILGRSIQFRARVTGANVTNFGVDWEVKNNSSENTIIDSNGILKVSTDETSKILTITAISKADKNVFDTTTVRTVVENQADNPMAITGVKIIPDGAKIGQGQSMTFAGAVEGEMNPPQDLNWEIVGSVDPMTRVDGGKVIIGDNEKPGLLTLIARAVYAPDVFAEVDLQIIAKDDPEWPTLNKPEVLMVVVTPAYCEVPENTLKIFTATVVGRNNPSNAVTWKMEGQQTQMSYITDQGVVIVGRGELADIMKVTATSVQNPKIVGEATIARVAPSFEPTTGIEDVPKAPLGAKYVRQRLANGDTAWVLLPEEAEENPPAPDPEIRDIDIDPEAVTVAPGSVISYAVTMETVGDLSEEVVWSIKGNDDPATHITPDGILYIADGETSKLITVRATSIIDSTKYGRATVAVDKEAPLVTMVTGVKIIPNDAEIIRGRSMKFQAVVTGVNLANQNIVWSLMGNNHPETSISDNGILTVHKDESASVLIVTATSRTDPTKSASCVVSCIPEQLAENVWEIHNVKILPSSTVVGRTRNVRFACVIEGVNNPPQDVIWEVIGADDIETHISKEGILFCGDEEKIGHNLTVIATPVYDPGKSARAVAQVVGKDDPRVTDTTVEMVVVSPVAVEAYKGDKITFNATVIGQNNPPQDVTWSATGQRSTNTLMNKLGVLTIGADENSRAITVRVASIWDPAKTANAFVTIAEGTKTDPKTGIADVPEAPLGTDYVRRRDISGKAIWVKVQDAGIEGGGGRGGYLGTFNTRRDLMNFEIPEDAQVGDYAIVSHDEEHQNFPAIYVVGETAGGVKTMVFDVVLGRPLILGDKLDILYVLDNETHSKYLRDIEVLDDFDTNDKRWDLHESPSAWKLVTELHPGFWNMIKHNPDRFKAVVAMNRHTGEVNMYLTCFTDKREFIIPVRVEGIDNPRPIDSTLRWSNTVAQGNTFSAANSDEFVQYKFDDKSFTLEVVVQNEIPAGTEPGVTPWATVIGEYTLLKNGQVVGPLADVTDPTGYVWVSNRESFMVGSAGDGTQMFCYNIDDDTVFIFDVPRGAKADYQMATDLNERYFMMFISGTKAVWVDRKEQKVMQITWRPTGYSGLSVPTNLTRPSISVDGKYYLHTSTNPDTPSFTTFSFATGNIVTESPNQGTSSSAIGLSGGDKVATNTPEGLISIYSIDSSGALTRIHTETPYEARYVVTPTGYGDNLLFVKVEDKADCPAWFVYDCATYTITSQSKFTNRYCAQTNPQGKGCSYIADSADGPRYLLTFAGETDAGLIIERDMAQHGVWTEYELAFGGLGNDKHNYNQPLIMEDSTILVTTDSTGRPRGYDMINHKEIDLSGLPSAPSVDGDNNLVQIDDTHFAWCTGQGIWFYRVEHGEWTKILFTPEQQAIVLGFNVNG